MCVGLGLNVYMLVSMAVGVVAAYLKRVSYQACCSWVKALENKTTIS